MLRTSLFSFALIALIAIVPSVPDDQGDTKVDMVEFAVFDLELRTLERPTYEPVELENVFQGTPVFVEVDERLDEVFDELHRRAFGSTALV